ncbi:proto-oncogene tyrosine-protein kinase receptor Ret-like isoform X1 [Argopecten irradians]|uniref:proto-oncogene tyrosine-protein kinase receptor Ret-like isoform X1 n=1 Tax=Argopecten irradians TaxID=31199 RepID=UPI003722A5C3
MYTSAMATTRVCTFSKKSGAGIIFIISLLFGLFSVVDCSTQGCKHHCVHSCDKPCLGRCAAGWKGSNCDKQCERFYYGINCVHSCGHCRDDATCDPVSGECMNGCVPGWTGQFCNTSCEPFWYGLDCANECGHCRQDKACNTVTGKCSAGCTQGWTGERCDSECKKGLFGLDCARKCGNCADNVPCDHVTGQCRNGCAAGWSGDNCVLRCTRGYFGKGCLRKCGNCRNGTCDHETGRCLYGCATGWQEPTCQEKCRPGSFGENCSMACGQCYKNTTCDTRGICTEGCRPGWRGRRCQVSCEKGYYGHGCTYKCGMCGGDVSCNLTTGECPNGCTDGYTGLRCLDVSGRSIPYEMSSAIVPVLVSCIVTLTLLFSATIIYFLFLRPRHGRFLSRFYRLTTRSFQEPEAHVYEQVLNGPWELNRYNLILTNERLGHGQFGMVKKGYVKKDRDNRINVAVKSLKSSASEKDKTDFINELNILKKVGHHPNVVCLVGACHIQGTMYVAMEYAKNGDLRSYLRKIRKGKFHIYDNTRSITPVQNSVLLKFALDVASGLNHLVEKQIIHRDVAARNVLLDDNLIAKVADFGLSKHDDTYIKTSNTRVPVRWLAPESLFNATYTTQSDVWSFGILLWEVFSLGGTPYHGLETQQMCNLLKQGFRLRRPKKCEPAMYAMMLQCWNERPMSRPQFSELCLRLQRMVEDSQIYMNLDVNEGNHYAEIDSVR